MPAENEVKVIDCSDVYNLGLTPAELIVAKARINGWIHPDIDYAAALDNLPANSWLRSRPLASFEDEYQACDAGASDEVVAPCI